MSHYPAETFGGSGEPSGVCSIARRPAALRRVGWSCECPAGPGVPSFGSQCACIPDQALTLRFGRWRPLRRSSGRAPCCNGRVPHAVAPRPPRFSYSGIELVGFCPSMLMRRPALSTKGYMRTHESCGCTNRTEGTLAGARRTDAVSPSQGRVEPAASPTRGNLAADEGRRGFS